MEIKELFRLLLDGKIMINETTRTVFKFDNDILVCGKYTGDFNSVAFRAVGIIDTNGEWSEFVIEDETPIELLDNFYNMLKELDNRGLFNQLELNVIKNCISSAKSRHFDVKWLNGATRREMSGVLNIDWLKK